MRAVQAMTGRGGWPMSVFLTPGGPRSSPAPTGRRNPPRHAGLPEGDRGGAGRLAGAPRRGPRLGGADRDRAVRAARGRAGRRPLDPAIVDGASTWSWSAPGTVSSAGSVAPEVPPGHDDRVAARPPRAHRDGRGPRGGRAQPRRHGPRWASTTCWRAGSRATPPTRAGWCPTSRRCSTTTRC
jgi:hypothetical protein